MELESKNLPPIELTRFDGDHSIWPDFIQNFKNRVHEKQSFTADIRMEKVISVLDGNAKDVLLSMLLNLILANITILLCFFFLFLLVLCIFSLH